MEKVYKVYKRELIFQLLLSSLLGITITFLVAYYFNQGTLSRADLIAYVVVFLSTSVFFYGLFLHLSRVDKTQAFDPIEEHPSLEALGYKPLPEPEYLSEDLLNVILDVIEVKQEDGVYCCLLEPGIYSEYTGSYYAKFTEEVLEGEIISLTEDGCKKLYPHDNEDGWSFKTVANLTLLPKPVTEDV